MQRMSVYKAVRRKIQKLKNMGKKGKELEVRIVPCFYDTKRVELFVIRYACFGNTLWIKSYGFIHFSSKESEAKLDYVCKVVERFNRIQNKNR